MSGQKRNSWEEPQLASVGRAVEGQSAPFFLAYDCALLYGGAFEDGQMEERETLIDADTDCMRLIERVNKHYALPPVIRLNRGNKMEIPPFAMKSNRVRGAGGGCDYTAWLEIRKAPTVTTNVCDGCDGTGAVKGSYGKRCEPCKGSGTV